MPVATDTAPRAQPWRHLIPVAALGVLFAGGCRAQIGDPCDNSLDCSQQGERTCDLSNRVDDAGNPNPAGKGECIIEGCSLGSCPEREPTVCVKHYGSRFLSVACDPDLEDIGYLCDEVEQGDGTTTLECPPECDDDGTCPPPPNDCEPNEVCLPEGLCADEITARTTCRRECDNDNDCRPGYECTRTGSDGIYLAPDFDNPTANRTARICVPIF